MQLPQHFLYLSAEEGYLESSFGVSGAEGAFVFHGDSKISFVSENLLLGCAINFPISQIKPIPIAHQKRTDAVSESRTLIILRIKSIGPVQINADIV